MIEPPLPGRFLPIAIPAGSPRRDPPPFPPSSALPMFPFRPLFFVWIGLACGSAPAAETWRTQAGETFAARLSGVHGPLAIFAEQGGTRRLGVEALDDAGIARVADFLAARPAQPPPWSESDSPVVTALRGKLGMLRQGKLAAFEPGGRKLPEFFAIFYGAGANAATRQFTPHLIARYQALKERHGERVEVIYAGRDGIPEDHTAYVRESGLPWPFIRFTALLSVPSVERWGEAGIPSLVVLNAAGDVVLDSVRPSGGYYPPDEVLRQFEALLALMQGESAAAKRALHRLTVLQHVRRHSAGEHAPKPWVLSLDPDEFQTLPVKRLVATLHLDEFGRVKEAAFEPALDAVLHEKLAKATSTWLFLPCVRNGQGQPFQIKIPLEF